MGGLLPLGLKSAVAQIVEANVVELLNTLYTDKELQDYLEIPGGTPKSEKALLKKVVHDIGDEAVLNYLNERMEYVYVSELGKASEDYELFNNVRKFSENEGYFSDVLLRLFYDKAALVGEFVSHGGFLGRTIYGYRVCTYITENGEVIQVGETALFDGEQGENGIIFTQRKIVDVEEADCRSLNLLVAAMKPEYSKVFEL